MADLDTIDTDAEIRAMRKELAEIKAMLRRLLTDRAGRRRPNLPPRTKPIDPAITTRAVRAMAKGE